MLFELLSLALLLILAIYLLFYFVKRIVPVASLALLGGIIVAAAPILLLLLPNEEDVVLAANLVLLYLLGNLVYYALKGKVPSRAVLTALGLVLLFSLPLVADFLTQQDEQTIQRVAQRTPRPEDGSIVLLGQGTIRSNLRPTPPEAFQQQLSEKGELIRYTARLYSLLGNDPEVIVSAGPFKNVVRVVKRADGTEGTEPIPEVEQIIPVLEEFGVPRDRIRPEPRGEDVLSSARELKKLFDDREARGENLERRIILVTSASEINRAMMIFQSQGFVVTPSPSNFLSTPEQFGDRRLNQSTVNKLSKILPSPDALSRSLKAFSEFVDTLRLRLRSLPLLRNM